MVLFYLSQQNISVENFLWNSVRLAPPADLIFLTSTLLMGTLLLQ